MPASSPCRIRACPKCGAAPEAFHGHPWENPLGEAGSTGELCPACGAWYDEDRTSWQDFVTRPRNYRRLRLIARVLAGTGMILGGCALLASMLFDEIPLPGWPFAAVVAGISLLYLLASRKKRKRVARVRKSFARSVVVPDSPPERTVLPPARPVPAPPPEPDVRPLKETSPEPSLETLARAWLNRDLSGIPGIEVSARRTCRWQPMRAGEAERKFGTPVLVSADDRRVYASSVSGGRILLTLLERDGTEHTARVIRTAQRNCDT